MTAGTLTSKTLTRSYLERIARLDDGGPMLNSVIEINPDAMKEAVAMDDELDRFKREVNLAQLAAARGYEIDRRKSSRASVVMRHSATGDKVVISRAGSGQHWTYFDAEELGVNVIYAGHYATETVGVRALTERVARHFGLPWDFLDHPTGM